MQLAPHARSEVLVADLAEMCDLVATAMDNATSALLDADPLLAQRVLDGDAVVGDFPSVQAVEELGRMDDLARLVAALVLRRHPRPVLPALLGPRFAAMGRIAFRMAIDAARIIHDGDPGVARVVEHARAEINQLHESLSAVLAYSGWHGEAVDASLLSRTYDQYADHACLVARHLTSAATGQA